MKKVFISIALLVGISLSTLAQTKEHKTRDRKDNRVSTKVEGECQI